MMRLHKLIAWSKPLDVIIFIFFVQGTLVPGLPVRVLDKKNSICETITSSFENKYKHKIVLFGLQSHGINFSFYEMRALQWYRQLILFLKKCLSTFIRIWYLFRGVALIIPVLDDLIQRIIQLFIRKSINFLVNLEAIV